MKLSILLLLISFNASAGSLLFTWVPPTERVDGALLNGDLAGYTIYYGNITGSRASNINITDPLATSHTLANLAYGTYYTVIASHDNYGLISDFSPEAIAIIEPTVPKPPTSFSAVALP